MLKNIPPVDNPGMSSSLIIKQPSFEKPQIPEVIQPEPQTEVESIQEKEDMQTQPPSWRAAWDAFVRKFKRSDSAQVNPSAVRKTAEGPETVIGVQSILGGISNTKDFNPLPALEHEPVISSDDIFKEIGMELRTRRELLSLTFEEIERHTRIRVVFLKALESGLLEDLPSPVQTRGILANYAAFLDLDADAILLRFADGLQARYREKRVGKKLRTRAVMTVNTHLPPLRTFIASDLLFGGGMAVLLLVFVIWGIGRVMTVRSASLPNATSPSISDVLVGTLPPNIPQQVTLIPAQETSQASIPEITQTVEFATLGPDVNVQITLTSIEHSFMRVLVDGKVQFEGRTTPNTDYTYQAKDQIEVLVGNAAGLKVTFNGQDLGLMGNFGEVIDRVYSAEGVVTPTSSPTRTLTATPNITGTPTQTLTPTPSVTRTPKSGG